MKEETKPFTPARPYTQADCDGVFGGRCEHCERAKIEGHDPATCALCDPDYDYMENPYWKPRLPKKTKK